MGQRSLIRQLKAAFLSSILAGGIVASAGADILRHHIGGAAHSDGSHVEMPGSCLDHAHKCSLALLNSSPKLVGKAPIGPSSLVNHADTAVPAAAEEASPTSVDLPPSRAPPVS